MKIYINIYIYICICMYVYIYIYLYIFLCMYVCMYVCMYLSVYLSIYIYIYLWGHAQPQQRLVPPTAFARSSVTISSATFRAESFSWNQNKTMNPRNGSNDRLRVEGPHTRGTSLGGVPREQKILKGHLPRVIYHQVCG